MEGLISEAKTARNTEARKVSVDALDLICDDRFEAKNGDTVMAIAQPTFATYSFKNDNQENLLSSDDILRHNHATATTEMTAGKNSQNQFGFAKTSVSVNENSAEFVRGRNDQIYRILASSQAPESSADILNFASMS